MYPRYLDVQFLSFQTCLSTIIHRYLMLYYINIKMYAQPAVLFSFSIHQIRSKSDFRRWWLDCVEPQAWSTDTFTFPLDRRDGEACRTATSPATGYVGAAAASSQWNKKTTTRNQSRYTMVLLNGLAQIKSLEFVSYFH